MQKLKDCFEYKFVGELKYASKGDLVKAKTLLVKAPTNKNLRDIIILEQEYEKSQLSLLSTMKDVLGEKAFDTLMKSRKSVVNNDDAESVTAESIAKQMIGGASNIDKCFSALENILLSCFDNKPTASIDGTTILIDSIYSEFSYPDTKNILGEYILNFLATSPNN